MIQKCLNKVIKLRLEKLKIRMFFGFNFFQNHFNGFRISLKLYFFHTHTDISEKNLV
jgi:hypothetical protein